MSSKVILIVLGEPNSIFSEVLFKYFKSKNFSKNKNKIVLVGSKKLLIEQMKLLKYNYHINEIISIKEALNKKINLVNVNYKFKNAFSTINSSSNKYIESSFKKAIELIKQNKLTKLINGPVSKTHFLKKKFSGITEYMASKTNSKNPVMLIYNHKLAVTPLTTHIPIKNVSRHVKTDIIVKNITKLNTFYKFFLMHFYCILHQILLQV